LRIALGGVLPLLLATKGSDVQIGPGAPHRLVAAAVDEVGTEDPIAIANEGVRPVPIVHAEVCIEGVRERVPGNAPAHTLLQALDVSLRSARDERKRGVARVQKGGMRDLIREEGAA